MARLVLLATLLVALLSYSSAQLTVCQNYSGTTTNATLQQNLLTAIVVRAALGGSFINPTNNQTVFVQGLFNSSGPLYAIFSGQQQYRVGAPNYTNTSNPALGVLVTHLVEYFGALFGCTAAGYPAVNNYNQYQIHKNMSITNAMETYFNTQLANTLYSFGVDMAVITGPATTVLGYFNRCGAPIAGINDPNNSPVQICGASDCPIATNSNATYCGVAYSTSSSSSSSGVNGNYYSSSSSTGNGAAGMYAASGLLVAVAAVVASLVL